MIPYTLLIFSALLGLLFRQTKYTYLSVIIGAVYLAADSSPATATFTLGLAAYLLPANLALYGMLPESGASSRDGIVRAISAAIQALVLVSLAHIVPTGHGASWFEGPVVGLPIHIVAIWILTAPVVLLFYSGLRLSFAARLLPLVAMWGLVSSADPFYLKIPGIAPALPFFVGAAALSFIYAATEYTWRSAHLDELTELPSRRSLMHRLAGLTGEYCIAMIDIDHFKGVNDKYGHDTGDQVLRFVASRLKGIRLGPVYRYGGEEFTIVTTSMDLKTFKDALEEVRSLIEDSWFTVRSAARPKRKPSDPDKSTRDRPPRVIPLTVSIGASQSSPDRPRPEEVIAAADKALYRAKKSGRNKVSIIR